MGIFGFKRGGDKKKKSEKAEAQKSPLPKPLIDQNTPAEGQSLGIHTSQANNGNGSVSSGSPRLGTTLRGTEWTDPPTLPALGSTLGNASLSRLDLPSQPWAFGDELARPRTSHGSGPSAKHNLMDDTFVKGSVSPRSRLRSARSQPKLNQNEAQPGIDRSPRIPTSPLSSVAPSHPIANPLNMHNAQSLSDNNLSTTSSSTADVSGLFDVSSPSSADRNGSPESVSSFASPSSTSGKAGRRGVDPASPLAAKSTAVVATIESVVDRRIPESSGYWTRDLAPDNTRLQSRATAARPPADTRARDIAKQKDLSIKVPRRKSWSTEINQLEKSWLEEQLSPRLAAEKPQQLELQQQRQQCQSDVGVNGRGPSPHQDNRARNPEEKSRNVGKTGGIPPMSRTDSMPLSPTLRDNSRNARNDFAVYENMPHHGLRSTSSRTNLARRSPQSPHEPHFQRDPRTFQPQRGNPTQPPHHQGRPPVRGQYPPHPGQADPRLLPRNQGPRPRVPPIPRQPPLRYHDSNDHGPYGQNVPRARGPASPTSPHSPNITYGPPNFRNAPGTHRPRPYGPQPHGPPCHPNGRHPNENPAMPAKYAMGPAGYRSMPHPSDRQHPLAAVPGYTNTSSPRSPIEPGQRGLHNASGPMRTLPTGQGGPVRRALPPRGASLALAKSPRILAQVQPNSQANKQPASRLPTSPDGDTACALPPANLPPTPVSRKNSMEESTDTTDDTPQRSSPACSQSEKLILTENTCEIVTPAPQSEAVETEAASSVESAGKSNDEEEPLFVQHSGSANDTDLEATVEKLYVTRPEAEVQTVLEVEPETGPEVETREKPEMEPEVQLETEPETEQGRELEVEPVAESEANPKPEPEAELEAQPESDHEIVLEPKPEPTPQLRISLPSPTANWPLPSLGAQAVAESPTKFSRPATPMALTPIKATFTSSNSTANTTSEEGDGKNDVSPASSETGLSPPRSKAFTASMYAREIGAGPYAFDTGDNNAALCAYSLETAGSTPSLPSLRQDSNDVFSHAVAVKPAMISTPDMSARHAGAWDAETPEDALSPESIGLARGLSFCAPTTSPRVIMRKQVGPSLATAGQGGLTYGNDMGMRTANIGLAIGGPGRGQAGQQTHTGLVDSFGTGFI